MMLYKYLNTSYMMYNVDMKKLQLIQLSERFKSLKVIPDWFRSLGTWYSQIKNIREALGMTQKQLAKRAKTTQQSIARLEKNEVNPTLDTLIKVSNALDCELVVNFIPKKNIMKNVEERAEEKARKIVEQTTANSAMELQKPSTKAIKLNISELKEDLIKNKRDLLW